MIEFKLYVFGKNSSEHVVFYETSLLRKVILPLTIDSYCVCIYQGWGEGVRVYENLIPHQTINVNYNANYQC